MTVNWAAISAIGQIVGAIAVVISLIYLARQVGSRVRETRLSSMRSTLDFLNRLNHRVTAPACGRRFAQWLSSRWSYFAPIPDYPYEARRAHVSGSGVCVMTVNTA